MVLTAEGDSKLLERTPFGVFGKASDHLDSVGVYTLKELKRGMHFGGNGSGDFAGTDFDKNPDESFATPVL